MATYGQSDPASPVLAKKPLTKQQRRRLLLGVSSGFAIVLGGFLLGTYFYDATEPPYIDDGPISILEDAYCNSTSNPEACFAAKQKDKDKKQRLADQAR